MKRKILKIFLFSISIITIFVIGIENAKNAFLENGTQVFEDDILTYYINIYYDGKDVYGAESSDTVTADVNSKNIYVEDKLPSGLIFDSFVTNDTDGIGAVNRKDGSGCTGFVVDGVNGLKYDENTHTVSFNVKNLQAGCMLSVGINTKTPELDDNTKRMDFYNTAFAQEDLLVKTSNTVHAWIGKMLPATLDMYKVTYEYSGEVPTNATALPKETSYTEGSIINLAQDATASGYTFSGWSVKAGSATITNNQITMPANDVVLVGSFTEDNSYSQYKVQYKITSTDNPNNFVLPKTKEYFSNETVTIDNLQKGTIFNGYRFSGWTIETENVSINENKFTMPEKDISFVGSWELVTYKIEYQFMGDVLPSNSNSLLPETKYYRPGTKIDIQKIENTADYEFLGWYSKQSFEMPEEDVIIYGEWKVKPQYFRPIITTKVIDNDDYFSVEDKVTFETIITAPDDVDLNEVYIKELIPNIKFISGDGYSTVTDQIVVIESLKKGESITLLAEYNVSSGTPGTFSNEVEIIGALSEKHELDRTVEYTASDSFQVDSKLEICNTVIGKNKEQKFKYHITGEDYDKWLEIAAGNCEAVNLKPGTYNVEEEVPEKFLLIGIEGSITKNNGSFITDLAEEHKITFKNLSTALNPDTKDNIIIFVIILIVVLIIIIFFSIKMSKKKKFILDNIKNKE